MSVPLPPNWESRFDPATNREYYVNTITLESQWEPPKGALPPPEQSQIDIPPPEQPAPFSEGTPSVVMPQQSLVPSSEQNAVSQSTESEIILPPPTVQQGAPLPVGWEERFDPSTNQPYYVNTITSESSWNRPVNVNTEPESSIRNDNLPRGWTAHLDPSTGRHYFINTITHASQWERPTEPAEQQQRLQQQQQQQETSQRQSQGLEAAVQQFSALQPQNTANTKAKALKFVTVGDGAVGKTCLLIGYTKHQFPEEYVPTVFDNHTILITYEGTEYNLGLWDTAGQEEYDRLRPLSYPNTDCFLLCFSVVSPASLINCTRKWKKEIDHYCPETKVILIGTKKDLRTDPDMLAKLSDEHLSPITMQEGEESAKEMNCISYIECSARTQEGVDEVFEEAIKACLGIQKKKKKLGCMIL